MEENIKRLHEMIDSITDIDTAEYLTTFICLFLDKAGEIIRHE